MQRILVGVDSSQGSVEALGYAVEIARRFDAELEVLYAFAPADRPTAAFPVVPDRTDQPRDTQQAKDEADVELGKWLQQLELEIDDLKVTWVVVPDARPSRALIERSADSDLLVVGARGRGGFGGLRLGATSDQALRHAHCPVLVTRRGRDVHGRPR